MLGFKRPAKDPLSAFPAPVATGQDPVPSCPGLGRLLGWWSGGEPCLGRLRFSGEQPAKSPPSCCCWVKGCCPQGALGSRAPRALSGAPLDSFSPLEASWRLRRVARG